MIAVRGGRNDWHFELCMKMFSPFFSVDWTKSHKNKDILKGKKASYLSVSSREKSASQLLRRKKQTNKRDETELCMK